MEQYLRDVLNPTKRESAEKELERLCSTEEGMATLVALMESNNSLAFIYLKNIVNVWIRDNKAHQIHRLVLPFKNTLLSCLFASSDVNFNILCSLLEILSMNYLLWPDFVQSISQLLNGSEADSDVFVRCIKTLKSVVRKYEVLPKSNQLYMEINQVVSTIDRTMYALLIENKPKKPSSTLVLLDIYYSIIFQDIPTFFEENAYQFIDMFCSLFPNEELQGKLCEILNLFILKYPECIDLGKVLDAVLRDTKEYEYSKFQLLYSILKKRHIGILRPFIGRILSTIYSGSIISEVERGILKDDPLRYTRNILTLEGDVYRSTIYEMLSLLIKLFGDQVVYALRDLMVPGSSALEEERNVYLCTIMHKSLNEYIRPRVVGYISSEKDCPFYDVLVISSFRFLLITKDYSLRDFDLPSKRISRGNDAAFITMHYLSNALKTHIEGGKGKLEELPISESFVKRVEDFMRVGPEDEFSGTFLSALVKRFYLKGMDAYVFSTQFTSFALGEIERNLETVGNYHAYCCFFDILGLILRIAPGMQANMVPTVQKILNKEIVELYSLTFYLLSIIVRKGNMNLDTLVYIVSQEQLWKCNDIVLSLTCLTTALYEKKALGPQFVKGIVRYLFSTNNEYCSYFLLNHSVDSESFCLGIEGKTDYEEVSVLLYKVFKKDLIDKEKFLEVFEKCLEHFEENYLSKRNVRRVIRTLGEVRDGGRLEAYNHRINEIIAKNMGNLNSEMKNVPFSIIEEFDL